MLELDAFGAEQQLLQSQTGAIGNHGSLDGNLRINQ